MNKTALLSVAGALAGAVTLAQTMVPAQAAEGAKGVRCFGIAAAGQNDCGNPTLGNSCAGQSKADYDGSDWKVAQDAEACMAEGGKLAPFEGKNPQKA